MSRWRCCVTVRSSMTMCSSVAMHWCVSRVSVCLHAWPSSQFWFKEYSFVSDKYIPHWFYICLYAACTLVDWKRRYSSFSLRESVSLSFSLPCGSVNITLTSFRRTPAHMWQHQTGFYYLWFGSSLTLCKSFECLWSFSTVRGVLLK